MNKLKANQQKPAECDAVVIAGAASKLRGPQPSREEKFHPSGMPGWSHAWHPEGLKVPRLIDATASARLLASELAVS